METFQRLNPRVLMPLQPCKGLTVPRVTRCILPVVEFYTPPCTAFWVRHWLACAYMLCHMMRKAGGR